MTRLAIALSGGGAAALGHIPVLDALDTAGIRPDAIAGSSMGALIGASYAAGHSAEEIRDHALRLFDRPLRTMRRFWKATESPLATFLSLDSHAAVEAVLPTSVPKRIEDLDIPLSIIVTDFHARCARTVTEGDLRETLAASIAIPGVFAPVRLNGRVCVDGGVSNSLPIDALPDAELTLAVDCAAGAPSQDNGDIPGSMAAMLGAMRIMMQVILQSQLDAHPDAVAIRPGERRFGLLEFDRAAEILDASAAAREKTLRVLEERLG